MEFYARQTTEELGGYEDYVAAEEYWAEAAAAQEEALGEPPMLESMPAFEDASDAERVDMWAGRF